MGLADIYADLRKLAPATIGIYTASNSRLIPTLRSGGSCSTRTYERVRLWFSNNWPLNLPWPADIPRPTPAPDSPYALGLAKNLGLDLNEAGLPSDNPPALNDQGQLADPRALAQSLVGDMGSIDPTALIDAMLDSYYQVIAQYADGKARAHKHPRAKFRAAEVLRALMDAGDVRFAERIAREQAVMENFSSLQTGAA